VSLTLVPCQRSERVVLRRLIELYRHDLSEFDGRDLDAHGEYGHRNLEAFWADADRHAYLFRLDDVWAGFALVREGAPHRLSAFFVLRKYRHTYVGTRAANQIFAQFPGKWRVRQLEGNVGATEFWRHVFSVPFHEVVVDGRGAFEFEII
jgi:predicted acetyltransferase